MCRLHLDWAFTFTVACICNPLFLFAQGDDPLAQALDGARIAIPAVPAFPALPLGPARRTTVNSRHLPYDLVHLVLAKFDEADTGPQLIALVEQTRGEEREVTVTRAVQETRTRKVRFGPPGEQKEVEETYTVTVPVTENRKVLVQVPAGKKPLAMPFDEIKIYRLDATQVTLADAPKLLEKMVPVFLLRGYEGEIKPIDGVYLQALNPNCLIVVAPKPQPAQPVPLP